ncbi:MAG: hypothetical protein PUC05_00730 [Firmicutes bacterium]|nr:hypothetical protein [Bacillota bacterium]
MQKKNSKRKKAITLMIFGVFVAAVIAAAAVIICSNSSTPEQTIDNMVAALNGLDFDGYVNTLHPALREDASKGMAQNNKQGYMLALRNSILSQYDYGSKIAVTHYHKEQLDDETCRSLEKQYGDSGYSISIQDAYVFYYYCVLLPDGTPDGLDSVTVVKSGGGWYLLS